MKENKIWWEPIAHFAGHIFVGTVIFLIMGSVSVGLSLLVHSMSEIKNIPPFTIHVLTGVEYIILVVDSVLYLAYIGTAAWGSMKEML